MTKAKADFCLAEGSHTSVSVRQASCLHTSEGDPDFIEKELKLLLFDLGLPSQEIPIDFIEKVCRYLRIYQTRDRDQVVTLLVTRRRDFDAVQRQVVNASLPPELAYVALVESHFQPNRRSSDDNAGLWQFNPDTARRCGLKVNDEVDERLDPRRSTQAACRYFSKLMQYFGPDSSLMLVLAAYNMGPNRLERRTRKLEDVSKRRDFWYLYQTRVLPALTRSHLARIIAAMLIGRHPQYFGFTVETPGSPTTITPLYLPVDGF